MTYDEVILILAFIGLVFWLIEMAWHDDPKEGQKYHDTWKDYWKELDDAKKKGRKK